MLSIGMVMPFLATLTNPEKWFKLPGVTALVHRLGISTSEEALLPVTMAFIAIVLCSAALRMLHLRISTRAAFDCGSDLSIEVFRRTLHQPYQVHLNRHSSELINGISTQVGYAALSLYQAISLVNSLLLLTTLSIALVLIDARIALIAAIGFGSCYMATTRIFRRQLARNAANIARESSTTIKVLQDGLGGIREIILDQSQPYFIELYQQSETSLRSAQGSLIFIGGCPRFTMEALGMGIIATLTLLLSQEQNGVTSAIPVMGALALAAQRMIPLMQQSYQAWVEITGRKQSIANTLALLDQPMPDRPSPDAEASLTFSHALSLEAIRFHYAPDMPPVVDGIDLTIRKGSKIGIVGTTGSGKSTLINLIMFLIEPDSGHIRVDGIRIDQHNKRAWQRQISHVPQNIFLADASFAENIAFGLPREQIDLERVRLAAKQAQLDTLIENQPHGYHTGIGEQGIRLSGGQRQRIGIARALYKKSSLLILDEATSALDNETEQEVMDAIHSLSNEMTILMIAHRLSTLQQCDQIIELRNGKLKVSANRSQQGESGDSITPTKQTGPRQ
jgi:ATP-binding cassette subfamily B protein